MKKPSLSSRKRFRLCCLCLVLALCFCLPPASAVRAEPADKPVYFPEAPLDYPENFDPGDKGLRMVIERQHLPHVVYRGEIEINFHTQSYREIPHFTAEDPQVASKAAQAAAQALRVVNEDWERSLLAKREALNTGASKLLGQGLLLHSIEACIEEDLISLFSNYRAGNYRSESYRRNDVGIYIDRRSGEALSFAQMLERFRLTKKELHELINETLAITPPQQGTYVDMPFELAMVSEERVFFFGDVIKVKVELDVRYSPNPSYSFINIYLPRH